MPNEAWDLSRERLYDEWERRQNRRFRYLGKLEIRTTGTKIRHNLGVTPNRWDIMPVEHNKMVPQIVWFYQDPDAEYLYVKSSMTGRYLISVWRE